jgi:hypothetical protein
LALKSWREAVQAAGFIVPLAGEIGAALSVIEPVYCGSSLKRMEQEGPPITQRAFSKET